MTIVEVRIALDAKTSLRPHVIVEAQGEYQGRLLAEILIDGTNARITFNYGWASVAEATESIDNMLAALTALRAKVQDATSAPVAEPVR